MQYIEKVLTHVSDQYIKGNRERQLNTGKMDDSIAALIFLLHFLTSICIFYMPRYLKNEDNSCGDKTSGNAI